MKALVLENKGIIKVKEVPYPNKKSGEAIIKIKAASICGSDISAFRGKGVQVPYPLIIGHEVSGIIESIETNDFDLKTGDRVILNPYKYCGECYSCSLGRTNCCEHLKVLGVQTDGAISEYFSHPIELLHKVPDNLEWEEIPLIEPTVIALHGLKRAQLKEDEHAVIIGAGPIGVLAAMIATAYGAIPIILDILESRLSFAKEQGIPHVVNTMNENALERISEITKGRMAEVVIEMSGANSMIAAALEYASYCGRVSLTGWPTGESSLNTSLITRKELDIRGARTGVQTEFEEVIDLISTGKVNVKSIITKVVELDKLAEAVEAQSDHPEDYLKIVTLM